MITRLQTAHQNEMGAISVLKSIESWCSTHKEIFFLENEIKKAETELELFVVATSFGPRPSANDEEAQRARFEAMKKRIEILKRTNELTHGELLNEIKNSTVEWQESRIHARMLKSKMMARSARQWPKSWHVAALEDRK